MRTDRESMEYDVVVVGAGPAGLTAAIRLKQRAAAAGRDISVCLLEKGSEVGAHILSGAVIEPRVLDELLPDWRIMGAPLVGWPPSSSSAGWNRKRTLPRSLPAANSCLSRCMMAVIRPSLIFRATLPTNPSQTTTSTLPV